VLGTVTRDIIIKNTWLFLSQVEDPLRAKVS